MAEERSFLERWSKRKHAAREAVAEPPPPAEPVEAPIEEPELEPPEIDPADLPPLDSIKSGVDVQAFLQKGVPKLLRQAALRRLWSADPKIRDFREVADYDWDFNAPGYGALLPKDDPKATAEKLLAAVRRVTAKDAPAEPPAERPVEPSPVRRATTTAAAPERQPEPPEPSEPEAPRDPAPQAAAPATPRRRRHGSAIPS